MRVPAAKHGTICAAAACAAADEVWLPALLKNVSDPRETLPDPNSSSVLLFTTLSDATIMLLNWI